MLEVKINSPDEVHDRLQYLGNRTRAIWNGAHPLRASIELWQDVRTRSQNNLYWRWLAELADQLSSPIEVYTKDDMHDLMRHKFLGTEEVQIGADVVTRLPSTTRLGKDQMSQYMGRIEAWAADMGVLLPVPSMNEYAKWREAQ